MTRAPLELHSRALFRATLDALSVFGHNRYASFALGRHLDTHFVFGRLWYVFRLLNVQKSPDNPAVVRMSPENGGSVRMSPEKPGNVRNAPKSSLRYRRGTHALLVRSVRILRNYFSASTSLYTQCAYPHARFHHGSSTIPSHFVYNCHCVRKKVSAHT